MRTQVRTGPVMSALVLLFMSFDGTIHLSRIAPVVDAFRQLRYPLAAAVLLGALLWSGLSFSDGRVRRLLTTAAAA